MPASAVARLAPGDAIPDLGPRVDSIARTVDVATRFQSAPIRHVHQPFLNRLHNLLLEHVFQSTRRESKVVDWTEPEKLERAVDLDLKFSPSSDEQLLQLARDVARHSVNTGHPYFLNQLFSSVDPYGLAGQWLTDALNPSVYTYEVAPVFTRMEEIVLAKMRAIVGYPQGDGIFSPGGSMANGYAINCARFYKFPQVKAKGLHSLPRLVLFTSEDAHYSIKKMAELEGLGSDNVYLVGTDARGRMDVADLRRLAAKAVEEGGVPFMVSATAGTTVLGAYDPIEEIEAVCREFGMWLHVDAAWGGGALMSKKYRHLLQGIQKADSVTWNPHKMLAAPQQCSTFLTKHPDILSKCHSANAQYLFQRDKFYDTKFDTGDKHVQCGRRADVLKFWFMWKAKGTEGLEKHVDQVFSCAEHFTQLLRERDGFELVIEKPECTNVTFWFVPPSLRNHPEKGSPLYNQLLHKVAPLIKERMMREGTMMITYQPHKEKPNFFRLVIQNSSLNHQDMEHVVNEIERLGRDL